jgi:RHS repeat-associated protein
VRVSLERETLHVMDDQRRIALIETRTVGDEVEVPVQLTRYQLANHLGSASLEVDVDGQIITYEECYPYGSASYQAGRSAAEVSLKRYRYTGMERDEETGLNYHGARYYAPWLGQWLSCDPLIARLHSSSTDPNEAKVYRYLRSSPFGYAACNPVCFIDPQGTENIVVAGAKFNDNKETKMNSVHQAVRQLVNYEKEDPKESRTLVIFKEGYTANQLNRIEQDVRDHGGTMVAVDSIDALFAYVATRKTESSKESSGEVIKHLDFFSHGLAGSIEFGHKTGKAEKYRLDEKNVKNLPVDRFSSQTVIQSFACRTALGNKEEIEFSSDLKMVDGPAAYEGSLAASLATRTDAVVRAYAIRSFYGNTRGVTETERSNSDAKGENIDGATYLPGGAIHPVTSGDNPRNVLVRPMEFKKEGLVLPRSYCDKSGGCRTYFGNVSIKVIEGMQ